MMLSMDVFQSVIDLDVKMLLFFNGMHNTYFDYFMSAYSGKWVWIPMYATILYVMLRNFSWKVALGCALSVALVVLFADQVCDALIRPYVERMRPANLNNPISELVHIVDNRRGGRYGFPSCHAANSFGLAFFLFLLFRKRWLTVFLMAWALVMCYSRVYLGMHYPGDLLAGGLVGATGAWLVYRLFVKVSGYKRVEHVRYIDAPIWAGGLIVLGMLLNAAIMTVASAS